MTDFKSKCIQALCLTASFVFFIIYLYLEFILSGSVSGLLRLALLLSGCLFLGLYSRKKYHKITKITYLCFFIVYIAFLLNLTLFDSLYGRHISVLISKPLNEIRSYIAQKTNFIPFNTLMLYINGYRHSYVNLSNVITNLLGNFIAFMPFGFFYPMFCKKCRKAVNFFILVTVTVVFIELSQLILMTGSFDVDDIILNVSGSLVVYLIYNKIKKENA